MPVGHRRRSHRHVLLVWLRLVRPARLGVVWGASSQVHRTPDPTEQRSQLGVRSDEVTVRKAELMSEQTPVGHTEEGSVPLEEDIATAPEVITDPKMRKVSDIGNHIKQANEPNRGDCPTRQLHSRY